MYRTPTLHHRNGSPVPTYLLDVWYTAQGHFIRPPRMLPRPTHVQRSWCLTYPEGWHLHVPLIPPVLQATWRLRRPADQVRTVTLPQDQPDRELVRVYVSSAAATLATGGCHLWAETLIQLECGNAWKSYPGYAAINVFQRWEVWGGLDVLTAFTLYPVFYSGIGAIGATFLLISFCGCWVISKSILGDLMCINRFKG